MTLNQVRERIIGPWDLSRKDADNFITALDYVFDNIYVDEAGEYALQPYFNPAKALALMQGDDDDN